MNTGVAKGLNPQGVGRPRSPKASTRSFVPRLQSLLPRVTNGSQPFSSLGSSHLPNTPWAGYSLNEGGGQINAKYPVNQNFYQDGLQEQAQQYAPSGHLTADEDLPVPQGAAAQPAPLRQPYMNSSLRAYGRRGRKAFYGEA